MAGSCGTCTACCKVFTIPEVKTSIDTWCQHCAVGKGCKIYDSRPEACRTFQCMWLESQGKERPLPLELRPDKSKVVMSQTTNPNVIAAITMPGSPIAWREGKVIQLI